MLDLKLEYNSIALGSRVSTQGVTTSKLTDDVRAEKESMVRLVVSTKLGCGFRQSIESQAVSTQVQTSHEVLFLIMPKNCLCFRT
jgi:hypothetical protein